MEEYTVLQCGCRPGLHEICKKCNPEDSVDPRAEKAVMVFVIMVWVGVISWIVYKAVEWVINFIK